MTDFCPHCAHCNPELAVGLPEPNNVASDLVALRAECRIRGISVSWDEFVATADAAKLVRKSSSTLSNWRDQGRGPSYRRRADAPVTANIHWLSSQPFDPNPLTDLLIEPGRNFDLRQRPQWVESGR